jgi:hypothetical protein
MEEEFWKAKRLNENELRKSDHIKSKKHSNPYERNLARLEELEDEI